MKKTSLKLKNVPKSQPTISSFLMKTAKENLHFQTITAPERNVIGEQDEQKRDDNRNKRKISPEHELNDATHSLLEDQRVPEVSTSPFKKLKSTLNLQSFPSDVTHKKLPPEKNLKETEKVQRRICKEIDCNQIAQFGSSKNECKPINEDNFNNKNNDLCDQRINTLLLESCSEISNEEKHLFSEEFENCNNLELSAIFSDEWECEDKFTGVKPLDLTTWKRCEIVECCYSDCHTKKVIVVKESGAHLTATCWIKGFWIDAKLKKGDIISITAANSSDPNIYLVDDTQGLIVTQPDTLVSGTAVMGSLFCKRKAVLQDKFRGVDGPNKAMIIGSLVHQLFQVALTKRITKLEVLHSECEAMMKSLDTVYMLHDGDVDVVEIKNEVMKYTPQILSFINKYVLGKMQRNKNEWQGTIDNILDIEENIWSPHIGVKGKIDVTTEVVIHNRSKKKERSLMPLELKTGRATLSPEHRGQVILYNMMLEHLDTPIKAHSTGLLLYLKDTIGVHEISAGHVEKRDLLMLRNELAYYLSKWTSPQDNSSGNSEDLAASDHLMSTFIELPEPVNHHSACGKCPYLTICSIYMKTWDYHLSDGHPLKKLESAALEHLTSSHMMYFIHWTNLICVEELESTTIRPLKNIWILSSEQRKVRGKCATDVKIYEGVIKDGDRFYHSFANSLGPQIEVNANGLQVGEYVVISTENKYALAGGTITQIEKNKLGIVLERDLTKRNAPDTIYNIDTYESQTLVTHNFTNLGLLMDNSEEAKKLRSIIIDKKAGQFDKKISRCVFEKSKDILKRLNTVQQRAVLKALAMQDYLLIRGMPGTGKTQTIVALIEILYRLGKQVLITSQTHSAVDNIFLRLKDSNMNLLRLGSSKRIHKDLLKYSEGQLMEGDPQDLFELYSKAQIVGVTCLGSNHSLLAKRCFDVCIVDESTQVLQPSILRPLFAARKFILVGDPDQLPPIVRSHKASSQGYGESLFCRLDCQESRVSLSLQYRMNKPIMNLANYLTYKDELRAGGENIESGTLFSNLQETHKNTIDEPWLKTCVSNKLSDSIVFLDTGNTSSKSVDPATDVKSKYVNVSEAVILSRVLKKLIQLGIKGSNIGVIAPYREQVAYLQKSCKANQSNGASSDDNCVESQEVEINTVDQFQGRDKMVVLFSCTRSRSEEENSSLKTTEHEILEDHRRLTVAVTRAKCKLIIIGDSVTLKKYTPFQKLIQGVKKCGVFIKMPELN